ncbi:MAG: nucleoside hydrolase [Candidatus Rokubacteria bacterium]|nr:nucleoside hydrolase [Candidatus Rokubacteria bacterium]
MRRLLVDTDPSAGIQAADVDDVLAIAFALGSPDAALEGLTVVAGNVELDEAVASALLTLEVLDRPGVPVYPGAAKALVRDRAEIRALLRPRREDPLARELWAEVPHPVARLRAQSIRAAEFIVETVLAAPGEITLVALGPLTNVALALLLEPNLAAAVREIVFMGGNLGARHPGMAAIEFNVANDPEAAHVVLRSGAPLTMVGLDVTTQTCLTLDELDAVTAAGTPAARFLRRTCAPWIRFVRARRALEGCWLHDPLAVAVALDPSLVTTERREVGVELRRDAAYGQTVAAGTGPVDVCVAVDDARFMARLLPALRRIVEGPR